MNEPLMDQHAPSFFHAITLQLDTGQGVDYSYSRWNLDGWIGGDDNKLWLKATGEKISATTETSELWVLYSQNVDSFWDIQAGLRHDQEPVSTTYIVVGVNGLAPYFFETEVHLFVSDDGDVSARAHEKNDLLITQKLILQPYAELNWFAQTVQAQNTGPGFSSGEIGLQLRYEFTRIFAPYIDIRYNKLLGDTADIADKNGAATHDVITSAGLQFLF